MKNLYILILFFFPLISNAQNWQCLQPGVDRYFVNHYLRGISIDSVQTSVSETIFYPFRSPRGAYQQFAGTGQLDPQGGSWLGKKVILRQDGTMLFDNLWGDTVVIKTLAGVSESWIFYNDTTSRYYTATVTSKDTMTVLGSLDSVKTITITAYDGSSVNTNDLAHNKSISFSKNHGFVEVFSVYTFPFHPSQFSAYQTNQDYLMDRRDVINGNLISYKITLLPNPTEIELYDFKVGDVFQWHRFVGYDEYWTADTISSKTINSPTSITYTVNRGVKHWNPPSGPNPPYYSNSFATSSFTVTDAIVPIISTMPEEGLNPYSYSINPSDNFLCWNSAAFSVNDGLYASGLAMEPCYKGQSFKKGLGKTGYFECFDPHPSFLGNIFETMIFSLKNGNPCGNFIPILDVEEIPGKDPIKVFPVPANDVLNISVNDGSYFYSLNDLTGKELRKGSFSKETSINVTDFPNGVYILTLTNEQTQNRLSQKIIVQH